MTYAGQVSTVARLRESFDVYSLPAGNVLFEQAQQGCQIDAHAILLPAVCIVTFCIRVQDKGLQRPTSQIDEQDVKGCGCRDSRKVCKLLQAQ
jgi:hypothetical protein